MAIKLLRWRRVGALPAAGLALLLGGGAGRQSGPGLILTNARVVTLDTAGGRFTTVAIGDGKILALADSVDPAWLRGRPRVIDLGGAVVAPALTDHHVHLFNIGMALLNRRDHGRLAVDLSQVGSLAQVDSLLRARSAGLPRGTWIFGSGWSQAAWGSQALPTADVLTRAAPNNPVFLARTDGHAGWLNAAALRAGGITRETPDPEGGRIVRLPSGEPSGILLERANELLTAPLPAPADADVVVAFRLAAQALADRGVVEVYDAGPLLYPGVVALNLDLGRYLALLVRADAAAPLPLRINLMIPAPSRLADSLLGASGTPRALSPRIRITHLKLFADGALGSRGAALRRRYADDSTTSGVIRMTVPQIEDLTRRALDHGLGVATHAIGDEAVHRTLDAYEAVLRERPGLNPRRLRIEHFSYAEEPDFARAARLGVILSIQSNFNALPGENPSLGTARVGAANEPRVYNWARLLALGAVLAEGSDYFTAPGAPLAGFAATLERKYAVGQGLPDASARSLAYRMNAARFDPNGERIEGVIRTGGPADLVAWTADPFTVSRTELEGVGVKLVVNAGRVLSQTADAVTSAAVCSSCAEWNAPAAPVRLFGNAWFVGTGGLSAILITSGSGYVLLDGALPESAPRIMENIRALGFRVEDIRLIVNSHPHFDHAGGIAAIQRASGAEVVASPRAAPVLRLGRSGADDPQYGVAIGFPPVDRVRVIGDGDTLRVGSLVLVAHFTPGHTPGGTSWTWRSCQEAHCLDFVYADSESPVSADGFFFTRSPAYPAAIADFERGLALLERLPCDVLLTPHPGASGLWERLAAGKLRDPEACRRYAQEARSNLARRVATESKQPQGL